MDLNQDNFEITSNEETSNSLQSFYYELLRLESREPLDSDLITVAKISEDSPEFQVLTESGITKDEFLSKKIPRGKLLKAGYVFVNRMYLPLKHQDMEKPIFFSTIDGIDFSKKTLLTKDEYQLILNHTKTHFSNEEIDLIREDMLSFQLLAKVGRPINFKSYGNLYNWILDEVKEVKDEEFTERLKQFFANYFNIDNDYYSLLDISHEVFRVFCNHIVPWIDNEPFPQDQVRNLDVSFKPGMHREQTLTNCYSPYLLSGFRFPDYVNLDLTIHQIDATFRINLMNWHLAGLGISETNEDSNKLSDHHFISIEQYYQLFLSGLTIDQIKERLELEKRQVNLSLDFDQEEVVKKLTARFITLIA